MWCAALHARCEQLEHSLSESSCRRSPPAEHPAITLGAPITRMGSSLHAPWSASWGRATKQLQTAVEEACAEEGVEALGHIAGR
jgi:hypothetical protein